MCDPKESRSVQCCAMREETDKIESNLDVMPRISQNSSSERVKKNKETPPSYHFHFLFHHLCYRRTSCSTMATNFVS